VSAYVCITCSCSPECSCTTLVDGVQTVQEARSVAESRGWYSREIGGNQIDWAPGHREAA
jgi:hypothetical protein